MHAPLICICLVSRSQKYVSKMIAKAASMPPAKDANRPQKNKNLYDLLIVKVSNTSLARFLRKVVIGFDK